MEYDLEDRLQHDNQNMFSGELRERCPHESCDMQQIKVVSCATLLWPTPKGWMQVWPQPSTYCIYSTACDFVSVLQKCRHILNIACKLGIVLHCNTYISERPRNKASKI